MNYGTGATGLTTAKATKLETKGATRRATGLATRGAIASAIGLATRLVTRDREQSSVYKIFIHWSSFL